MVCTLFSNIYALCENFILFEIFLIKKKKSHLLQKKCVQVGQPYLMEISTIKGGHIENLAFHDLRCRFLGSYLNYLCKGLRIFIYCVLTIILDLYIC